MFNIQAELSGNLQVYDTFFQNRAAVRTPAKPTIPLVWDLYMDAEKPVGMSEARQTTAFEPAVSENTVPAPLESVAWEAASRTFQAAAYAESAAPVPLAAFSQAETGAAVLSGSTDAFAFGASGEGAATVTYLPPVSGDVDLLRAVNDRLKTQARRYPHPITNDMDRPE